MQMNWRRLPFMLPLSQLTSTGFSGVARGARLAGGTGSAVAGAAGGFCLDREVFDLVGAPGDLVGVLEGAGDDVGSAASTDSAATSHSFTGCSPGSSRGRTGKTPRGATSR